MAMQVESLEVGQVVVVDGIVRVESVSGVSKIIQPNSAIFLGDRVVTGSDGAVSIVFNDDHGHLDVGGMTDMVIDQDVIGGQLGDLPDVAVEFAVVDDLLQSWEPIEPLIGAEPVAIVPAIIPDGDAIDSMSVDGIPGMDSEGEVVDAADNGDDGFDGIDSDLDLSHLIPPPDDVT